MKIDNLPELPDPMYIYHHTDDVAEDDIFEFADSGPVDEECPSCERLYTADALRAYAEEAVKQERERAAQSALRMVNGRLVGPTLCDVPPEALHAASRKLMEDPEYRAKILDLSARSRALQQGG